MTTARHRRGRAQRLLRRRRRRRSTRRSGSSSSRLAALSVDSSCGRSASERSGSAAQRRSRRRGRSAGPVPRVAAVLRHAGPARMVERLDEPLGVGHQAEDPAGRVADARGRARRAVGIGGIVLGRLARARRRTGGRPGRPRRAPPGLAGSAMRNLPSPWATGSSIGSANGDERREAGPGQEPDPARLEPARVVVGERRAGRGRSRRARGRPGPGPGSRCRCPGSGRRGRGTAAGRRPGRCPSRVARIRPAPRSSP